MFFGKKVEKIPPLIVVATIDGDCNPMWSVQEYDEISKEYNVVASCDSKERADQALIHLGR